MHRPGEVSASLSAIGCCDYLKPARNSGRNAPAGLVYELFDMSVGPTLAVVTEKEHLIEPHAGDDKRTVSRQPLGRAGCEVTSLHNALKEQLDRLAPIGIEILV